ncbi:MAG: tetratricopeptide repeat protein, partial [Candidatus Krumholzibacteria bacterium]|nr:tetratricopeptide repeat protein [Candidatus Krumholzibacteria bacterium]
TMEIVRLETMLGREGAAFREGVRYLDSIEEPSLEQARFLFDIFRRSERKERLEAVVDSVGESGSKHPGFFLMLQALLMVEAGEYDKAGGYIDGKKDRIPDEREFCSLISFFSAMDYKKGDEAFDALFARSLEVFLERHSGSPFAPGVILIKAMDLRESSLRKDPQDRDGLLQAVILADSVLQHPKGAIFAEKASLFKARVQLEDLFMPDEAIETLDCAKWRNGRLARTAEEVRVRALLASGRWEVAKRRLWLLSKVADSTLATLGSYGLGRLHFLKGDYGKAVSELSELARRHAQSPWANDALETAMMVQSAMEQREEPLDLFRAALVAEGRGDLGEAIEHLEALEAGFTQSVLSPRALFLRAELKKRLGLKDQAEADLVRLAEKFPLHELAPRALEMLGDLMKDKRPGEAAARYGEIIERYPDDPFLERVRTKYIALRKLFSGDEGLEGKM